MGRQGLRLTVLLGVLITGLGGTGIFAVFTDRATTGTNSAETGSRPSAVDMQISEAIVEGGAVNCDPDQDGMLSDNLATGVFSITNMQPGVFPDDADIAYICLRNAGSGTIDIEATVIDLVDTDTGCTGDEAAAGDTTCGAGQAGELSGSTAAQLERVDCATAAATGLQSNSLANWVGTNAPLAQSVTPGAYTCLRYLVWVPASTDETTKQLIQSDKVEWRFAFDAALSS